LRAYEEPIGLKIYEIVEESGLRRDALNHLFFGDDRGEASYENLQPLWAALVEAGLSEKEAMDLNLASFAPLGEGEVPDPPIRYHSSPTQERESPRPPREDRPQLRGPHGRYR